MSDKCRVENTGRRVERESERLRRPDCDRVITAIQALAETPHPYGVKQPGPGIYRLRVGNYRVIYQVLDDEHLVLIGRVMRRSECTCRKWRHLFEETAEYDTEPIRNRYHTRQTSPFRYAPSGKASATG